MIELETRGEDLDGGATSESQRDLPSNQDQYKDDVPLLNSDAENLDGESPPAKSSRLGRLLQRKAPRDSSDLSDSSSSSGSDDESSPSQKSSRCRRCCLLIPKFNKTWPRLFFFLVLLAMYHLAILFVYFFDFVPDSDQCKQFHVPKAEYKPTSIPEKFWPADPRFTSATRTQEEMPLTQAGSRFSPDLRLNELHWAGFHNCYHIETKAWFPVWWYPLVKSWHYSHEPLGQQLCSGNIYFEFDLHIRSESIMNYHLQFQDQRSHCACFADCLQQIRYFSDEHPNHFPLMVYVGIKTKIVEDARWRHSTDDLLRLEQLILQYFDEDRILTPDMVRRNSSSLRQAVTEDGIGFPRLSDVLGRTIFILGEERDLYLELSPNLEERVMFVIENFDDDENEERGDINRRPNTAFTSINPLEYEAADIKRLVDQGYVVKTRVDHVEHQNPDEWETRISNAVDGHSQVLYMDFNIHKNYGRIPAERLNVTKRLVPITALSNDATGFCKFYAQQPPALP